MSLDKIVKNDYGQVIELTVIDVDTNAAADISAYTTIQQMILIDPSANPLTVTAAFKTDGTDGIVDYTLVTGNIDESGNWGIRAVVKSASAVLSSEIEYFDVLD